MSRAVLDGMCGTGCRKEEDMAQEEKQEVGVTKARQGVTGHNVRYVLAISLGVAALLLIALVIAFT
jgi:hypothetical protein